jgi:hypothetical protein
MKVVVSSKSSINMVTYTVTNIAYSNGNYVLTTTESTKTYAAGSYILMILG